MDTSKTLIICIVSSATNEIRHDFITGTTVILAADEANAIKAIENGQERGYIEKDKTGAEILAERRAQGFKSFYEMFERDPELIQPISEIIETMKELNNDQ